MALPAKCLTFSLRAGLCSRIEQHCTASRPSQVLSVPNFLPRQNTSGASRKLVLTRVNLDPKINNLIGEDFGARDPTAGEIESNFTAKVLGNADTWHVVKPPDAMAQIVGLKSKKCIPCEGKDVQPLDVARCESLRQQVPGWKLTADKNGVPVIRQEWKVKNFKSGLELFARIAKIAEEEGHHPDLHLEGYNNVYAELSTHSVGGLTENDFIMAAKINEIDTSDLQPKKKPRFWA